ncbi:hypothetical protein BDY19DRAFT_901531 [Irpex rosettiformis]|uniref:Uncharacterized protein n=1 Tax=Irpex rosettiformis TaxID=378272 RepID=A0ACB8UKW5_9APHY|nr:hypothetical protein BDY19DRAFT_901531 [Irpex rosettiformis]
MAIIPNKQLSLFTTKTETRFQTFPISSLGPNEVVIRNIVVESNPKDWKAPHWIPNYSGVEWNDVTGYVVKVGYGVTEYEPGGERIAAFTRMGAWPVSRKVLSC